MQEFDLNSTGEVIDVLGGNPAVGELTGSNANAVSNWRGFNLFPAWTYLSITKALSAIGKSAPDSLWKMQPPAPKKRQADEASA